MTPATMRGVYLWAGDATVRLQRAKFPDADVDVDAHRHAHSSEAARELAATGINYAFLTMNWGFPPEEETEYWDQFNDAVGRYHGEGFRVIGYVQASNCLAEGSHAGRDWYARTPAGRTIPYYRNRLMTCWNHPDWIEQVAARARQVVAAGADGVFFDNLWMGATPWILDGRVGGFAGCACAHSTRMLWCSRTTATSCCVRPLPCSVSTPLAGRPCRTRSWSRTSRCPATSRPAGA
jgi:Hypothetical glycosyl hydrolase family 15